MLTTILVNEYTHASVISVGVRRGSWVKTGGNTITVRRGFFVVHPTMIDGISGFTEVFIV